MALNLTRGQFQGGKDCDLLWEENARNSLLARFPIFVESIEKGLSENMSHDLFPFWQGHLFRERKKVPLLDGASVIFGTES